MINLNIIMKRLELSSRFFVKKDVCSFVTKKPPHFLGRLNLFKIEENANKSCQNVLKKMDLPFLTIRNNFNFYDIIDAYNMTVN